MDLGSELARPHLDQETRVLAIATAAVWPADWPRLRAAVEAGRGAGVPREQFEEALLQGALFFGFPRAITAFEQLLAAWPAEAATSTATATGDVGAVPPERREAEGRRLFAAIYGKNDEVVRAMLQRLSRELHDFVLEAAYGRILARPGMAPARRELLAVTALAALRQTPQLVAHARGARAFGCAPEAIREAIFTAVRDEAEAAGLQRLALAGRGEA